jgi:hypothetical protein
MSLPVIPWYRLLTVDILQLRAHFVARWLSAAPTKSTLCRLPYNSELFKVRVTLRFIASQFALVPSFLRLTTRVFFAPVVLPITSWHAPRRKHRFQQFLCCSARTRCCGNLCVSWSLPSNGCTPYNIKQVLGRTNRLLSLIWHRPHRKWRVQQFFYCCVCIRCRGNIFTEPLPSNDRGIHI